MTRLPREAGGGLVPVGRADKRKQQCTGDRRGWKIQAPRLGEEG